MSLGTQGWLADRSRYCGPRRHDRLHTGHFDVDYSAPYRPRLFISGFNLRLLRLLFWPHMTKYVNHLLALLLCAHISRIGNEAGLYKPSSAASMSAAALHAEDGGGLARALHLNPSFFARPGDRHIEIDCSLPRSSFKLKCMLVQTGVRLYSTGRERTGVQL